MRECMKRFCILAAFALLIALLLVTAPFSTRISQAATHTANANSAITVTNAANGATVTLASPWAGLVNTWANVRTGPSTSYAIFTTDAPGTNVSVYATVVGQAVLNGNANWYRISSLNSSPLYIYSSLVTRSSGNNSGGGGTAPSSKGKVIVVSLSHQWLYAYENGKQVLNAAVMTGRPSLPTPTGTYHVFAKLSPTTFYSPWPPGSPYWYPPTHINYALEWRAGGYFLHDSWWHSVYGPGTNGWHYDPKFGWQWGSHGCVAMPLNVAAWLYNWAPIGTTVQINP